MSTAGKVLTVLVLLASAGWLLMMSAVAQLNVNWAQKIASQQEALDNVTKDLQATKQAALAKTEEARFEQDFTETDKRVLEARIITAERGRSSRIEDLTRLQAQVIDIQAAVETAKKNQATREAEKVADEEGLAKRREEIAKLQAINADLKVQLAQLQGDFKRILAENAAKVAKAASKSGAGVPALSGRESPSSE